MFYMKNIIIVSHERSFHKWICSLSSEIEANYLLSNPQKGHGNKPLRCKRICIYNLMTQSLLRYYKYVKQCVQQLFKQQMLKTTLSFNVKQSITNMVRNLAAFNSSATNWGNENEEYKPVHTFPSRPLSCKQSNHVPNADFIYIQGICFDGKHHKFWVFVYWECV